MQAFKHPNRHAGLKVRMFKFAFQTRLSNTQARPDLSNVQSLSNIALRVGWSRRRSRHRWLPPAGRRRRWPALTGCGPAPADNIIVLRCCFSSAPLFLFGGSRMEHM
jgi:hypothetical protein